MPKDKIDYSNGEVTVVWQPKLCRHSGVCVRGLPIVFDYKRRPWVDTHAAETEKIIQQVKQCPSGALSFFMNNENVNDSE